MILLIFHIFAIGVIIAVTGVIAYNAGKNSGGSPWRVSIIRQLGRLWEKADNN
jgi:hypothetical protein|tara:strand:- start:1357 stop:1515 length:159 start_codon:yes stop_codon:yes gene_type:complete